MNSVRNAICLSLLPKLSSRNHLAEIFQSAEINLSFFGLGLSVKNTVPVTDIETALSRMLSSLKEHGKKVLILIDEAVNNTYMRQFSSSFQILIREDLPLFLLMTGLYENVYKLQNEKSLIFLYQAPKIDMKPLNLRAIAENYQNNFNLSEDEARQMSLMTKGYSFAFQVLGYFTFQHSGQWRQAYDEYREYLSVYVYEKIWSELSAKDKSVAYALAKSENGSIRRIREFLHMETNQFNPYRQRLIRKGIVDGSTYGILHFTLPLFDLFAIENYENEQF